VPPNSIPMLGRQGEHDYITMGGMFTALKVRNGIGPMKIGVRNPKGTLASPVAEDSGAMGSNHRRRGGR